MSPRALTRCPRCGEEETPRMLALVQVREAGGGSGKESLSHSLTVCLTCAEEVLWEGQRLLTGPPVEAGQ